ncbi:MAG: FG-GAP repeat domain-containing protein, partial [Vicinamibacteria bacterium]
MEMLWMVLAVALAAEDPPASARFVDVTEKAGIRFTHENGAFGKKYLPETMGSGCAFFDFDSDGDQDILLVNGTSWPGAAAAKRTTSALYRNLGNGTFEDATRGSGFDRAIYGMGVAIADYDSDGDPDVYIT